MGNTSVLYESFNAKKLNRVLSRECFFFIKQRSSVSEPPFMGGIWVTYVIHLLLVGKLVVDFL